MAMPMDALALYPIACSAPPQCDALKALLRNAFDQFSLIKEVVSPSDEDLTQNDSKGRLFLVDSLVIWSIII